MAAEPAPEGSQAGWTEREEPKGCSPRPGHAWWAGETPWKATLWRAFTEGSVSKQRVSWTRAVGRTPRASPGKHREGARALLAAAPGTPDGRGDAAETHL